MLLMSNLCNRFGQFGPELRAQQIWASALSGHRLTVHGTLR
jgi:hypothetical protein